MIVLMEKTESTRKRTKLCYSESVMVETVSCLCNPVDTVLDIEPFFICMFKNVCLYVQKLNDKWVDLKM